MSKDKCSCTESWLAFARAAANKPPVPAGVTDAAMTKLPCPPACSFADCDDIYFQFNQIWRNCLDDTCRAQVEAAYAAALAGCVSA